MQPAVPSIARDNSVFDRTAMFVTTDRTDDNMVPVDIVIEFRIERLSALGTIDVRSDNPFLFHANPLSRYGSRQF